MFTDADHTKFTIVAAVGNFYNFCCTPLELHILQLAAVLLLFVQSTVHVLWWYVLNNTAVAQRIELVL